MIAQHVLAILWLALVAVTYSRLLKRQDVSNNGLAHNFRTLIVASGICLTLAALIFWLSAFSAYTSWFVPVVYSVLDWLRIALVIVGGALILWAFIHQLEADDISVQGDAGSPGDSSLESRSTIDRSVVDTVRVREMPQSGLASLNALRVALSQPYPFAELARAALTGLSEVTAISRGALYVHNESTQEMTLVASEGLSPEQERAIERLPLGGSILTEVFAGGETLISASFASEIADAKSGVESRLGDYSLLTPIFRNNQPLGLVAHFSEVEPSLTKPQIVTLAQMSDIVADKFVNVKLRGELARFEKRSAEKEESRKRLVQAFQKAFDALSGSSSTSVTDIEVMCQALVGIGGADAVALVEFKESIGESGGELHFEATSSDFPKTTDGFESATIQALQRQSLVLLSREKRDSGGNDNVPAEREPMALVAPLNASGLESGAAAKDSRGGILFWNSYGRFHLGAEELHEFQNWLRPLRLSLRKVLQQRRTKAAAGMLEIIKELLQPEERPVDEKIRMKRFLLSIRKAFELQEACLVFKRSGNGQLRPVLSFGVAFEDVAQLVILAGEGSLGRCAALGASVIEEGAERLSASTGEYDMLNRDVFGSGFGRMGDVGALLIAPITVNGGTRYVFQLFFADAEQARSVSKAVLPLCHLLALILSIEELQAERGSMILSGAGISVDAESAPTFVNDVNNDLLTIIGNCQLASEDPNLSGGLDRLLHLVIDRAEHSAKLIKSGVSQEVTQFENGSTKLSTKLLTSRASGVAPSNPVVESTVSLTEELRGFAAQRVVGGQILLTEGKAREVEFDLEGDFTLRIAPESAKSLIEQLCHGLSALADEREIVTVSVYDDNSYSYLDISRRWRNLPLSGRIGSYARFGTPQDGVFDISAGMLKTLSGLGVETALDRRSNRPAYVTLRIRHQGKGFQNESKPEIEGAERAEKASHGPRILAIDDQAMILDLLGAMCDSLGYQIDTFDSPARAVAAFERGLHEVVITDVAMPGIDGWEVAAAIKKLRPETYLIFITGWEEGLSQERLKDCDVNHVLKKPFRLEQLTEALLQAERFSKIAMAP